MSIEDIENQDYPASIRQRDHKLRPKEGRPEAFLDPRTQQMVGGEEARRASLDYASDENPRLKRLDLQRKAEGLIDQNPPR